MRVLDRSLEDLFVVASFWSATQVKASSVEQPGDSASTRSGPRGGSGP